MYNPKYTKNQDTALTLELIEKFPLGLMTSYSERKIHSNYLPFFTFEENGEIYLLTHLAKANPQWKNLGSEVVINFLGPNCYVSPSAYVEKDNVPTWNYAAVELRGPAEVILSGKEINDLLHQSVEIFERRNNTNWIYTLPEQMQKHLEAAIIGLKVKVTEMDAKFKLNQNRSAADYAAVLKKFGESSLPHEKDVFAWMLKSPRPSER